MRFLLLFFFLFSFMTTLTFARIGDLGHITSSGTISYQINNISSSKIKIEGEEEEAERFSMDHSLSINLSSFTDIGARLQYSSIERYGEKVESGLHDIDLFLNTALFHPAFRVRFDVGISPSEKKLYGPGNMYSGGNWASVTPSLLLGRPGGVLLQIGGSYTYRLQADILRPVPAQTKERADYGAFANIQIFLNPVLSFIVGASYEKEAKVTMLDTSDVIPQKEIKKYKGSVLLHMSSGNHFRIDYTSEDATAGYNGIDYTSKSLSGNFGIQF